MDVKEGNTTVNIYSFPCIKIMCVHSVFGDMGGSSSRGEEEPTEEMRKRQVVLKRDEPSSRNSTTSSHTIRSVRYGECQKNHAASVGGYAVDGCREFMASGEEGTTGALTCAACGCHRNFHRREVETEAVSESSSPSSHGK